MDRGSSLFSLCVLIYCVFQTARFSNGDENACPCPEIPLVNLTEPPQKDCFKIGKKFRYTCKAGYLREAGTSNLITCIQDGGVVKWTERYLKCKRDPRTHTPEPTNPRPITETTNIDATSTARMASDSLPAGKFNFVTEATNAAAPPLIVENRMANFVSEPKYIVSSCVGVVCIVALVGGIIYLYKRWTVPAAQPPSAENIPMANAPSE